MEEGKDIMKFYKVTTGIKGISEDTEKYFKYSDEVAQYELEFWDWAAKQDNSMFSDPDVRDNYYFIVREHEFE